MNEIKLGNKVRDRITGFEGTVTGKAEYLYKETVYCVESIAVDAKPLEEWWFTAARLEVIE